MPATQVRNPALWCWRRAAPVRRSERLVLGALVLAGVLSLARLVDWWFRPQHVAELWLFLPLSLGIGYGAFRLLVGWANLIGIRQPEPRVAPPGLSVAIYTTSSPSEPLGMFDRTLAACARIRYPHTTYLLDDTQDPRLRQLAERHGAVWLELVGLPGAKAGKINAALAQTREDFVLVLDPDHIPFPSFLDRVLGHFEDPRVGYVQVSQAYYNQARSFVARAAAEQTYAFYGPIQAGLHGHGASPAIGANCTFRRAALASIGGHGIGLAEDLVTSIRLHAAGWRSVYVPEIVSRGLVPEDLGSFYRQQLKWARGVWEMAFAELPTAWRQLTWRQRLSYLTIGTYYLYGLVFPLMILIPYVYLWTGRQPASMPASELLVVGGPVVLVGVALYRFSHRWLCWPEGERGLHLAGLALKVACWPVFLAGTLLAVARREVPYIPTAKEGVRGEFFRLAAPHLAVAVAYVATLGAFLVERLWRTPEESLWLTSMSAWGMVAFATLTLALLAGGILAAWQARRPPTGGAWDEVEIAALPEEAG